VVSLHFSNIELIMMAIALSLQFVRNAVELLVTRFIPLRKEDLELWSEDPEEWVNLEDKESDQWEFELRVRFISSV
jgi:hypothetical protein